MISLAIAAAQSGRRVYCGTLADLITSLEKAQAAGRLQARLKGLTHPARLVVDESGYLPISRTRAMLFFGLMTRRYEHASTVLTSNRGFEVGEIFGDDVMAAALIDRLVHHSTWSRSAATATACGSTLSFGRPCTHRGIPSPPPRVAVAPVRRPRRSEARPLVDLSDCHPAELSGYWTAVDNRSRLRGSPRDLNDHDGQRRGRRE